MSTAEPQHECENCGRQVYYTVGGECVTKCSNTISERDIRQLVEELREDASDARDAAWEDADNTLERASSLTKAEGIEYAVGELEALIQDE